MEEYNTDSSDKQTHHRSKKIKTIDAIGTLNSGETTTMHHIPQEIIEEILVRLPVKSLFRFKCIAKSWLALISSPKFIKAHVTYSTHRDPTLSNYRLMLSMSFDRFDGNGSSCIKSFVLLDFCTTDAVDGADRTNNETKQRIGIHSSCNGLLCVTLHHYSGLEEVYLWNPCLRMSTKLPPPPRAAAEGSEIWRTGYCIAYDDCNDDYNVVKLLSSLPKFGASFVSKVEIYSLKNDSWKRTDEYFKGFHLHWSSMVYASGKIHLVAPCEGKYLSIVSLDLETDVYGTVELLEVEHENCHSLSVVVLKGCISILYSHARYADVWVLREYGVKESWTKLLSIPYVVNHCQYLLLFVWNGKYLLRHGSHLAVYDPKDSSFVNHSFVKGSLDYIGLEGIYVESLVPLPEMKGLAPLQI